MLSAVMLSVVMLSVVVPSPQDCAKHKFERAEGSTKKID
jgi:hypothetical protein